MSRGGFRAAGVPAGLPRAFTSRCDLARRSGRFLRRSGRLLRRRTAQPASSAEPVGSAVRSSGAIAPGSVLRMSWRGPSASAGPRRERHAAGRGQSDQDEDDQGNEEADDLHVTTVADRGFRRPVAFRSTTCSDVSADPAPPPRPIGSVAQVAPGRRGRGRRLGRPVAPVAPVADVAAVAGSPRDGWEASFSSREERGAPRWPQIARWRCPRSIGIAGKRAPILLVGAFASKTMPVGDRWDNEHPPEPRRPGRCIR